MEKLDLPWMPIVAENSSNASSAWEAVYAIAYSVRDSDYSLVLNSRRHRVYEDALLFAYMALATGGQEWVGVAVERMNQAIESACEFGSIGLFGGLCGLGWVLEHISTRFQAFVSTSEEQTEVLEEDLNEETDRIVVSCLRRPARKGNYDLIGGPVGWGVYFLERFPNGTSEEGIALVVRYLEKISEQHCEGVTWFTPPSLVPDGQRERYGKGYFNLGVAHGIPGILHFLGEAYSLGIEKQRARVLLDRAMPWLLAQSRPSRFKAWFPAWVAPGAEPPGSRPTWCYGDLGITSIVLQLARRTDREDWRQFGFDLLDHCLAFSFDRSGINDAPLCHGATGCAHIYNRIYQTEQDLRCRDASRGWLDRAMRMRKPNEGIGGFVAYRRPDVDGPVVWEANPAFLDGAIGVALALLAALGSTEPAWDRTLLLSSRIL